VPKFTRETVAFGLARAAGLPVPDVVVHDRSCRHAPYEALAVRRLPGRAVEQSWPDLDTATRERLARQVGEVMGRLHGIDPGGFGEMAAPPATRTRPLADLMHEALEERLADALHAGVLEDEDAARAREVVAAREAALRRVTRPALVHGDLHFGNVLHVGDRITGVLDFEWSRSGDPVDELVSSWCVRELCPRTSRRVSRPMPSSTT
jgi:aminoglycoside phosphotransferase (APT) family kinase protein